MTTRAERHERIQARVSALGGPTTVHAATQTEAPAGQAADTRTTAELWLYGVVGGYWWGFNSETVADALRGLDVDHIQVRLHSPGGDALDGIAIGNLLRNHKADVTVVVDGLAASAASVIALAGDEVVMSPGAQLMIHDPWMLTVGNAAELHRGGDFLDKQAENYAGLYAGRAGGDAATWRTAMLADTWYNADEAVEAKLADRVGTVTTSTPPPAPPAAENADDTATASARAAWDLEVLVHPAARAVWRERGPQPPSASAVGSHHTEGGTAVALSPEQITMRQKLGIAEDADEATTLAALTEALDERADAPVASTTPAAALPEGHVAISAAKLADLEAAATLATTTAASLRAKERTAFLDSVREKYLPTSRAGWEAEYDRDEAGVRAHFDKAPVLIPTAELGHGGEPETSVDGLSDADNAEIAAFAAQLGLTKEDLRG